MADQSIGRVIMAIDPDGKAVPITTTDELFESVWVGRGYRRAEPMTTDGTAQAAKKGT